MRRECLFLDGIEIGDRLRSASPEKVEALAASIREIGLQTPITVIEIEDSDGVRLVAGAHRLAATRAIGEEMIECVVFPAADRLAAELWEIDENLIRAELSDAERAVHHANRKEILERKGLVQAHGGDRKSSGQNGQLKSYADDAAAKLGVSAKTVRRDVLRGSSIAPEVIADVAGTSLDKGVVLDELARTPRDDQRAKLEEIQQRRSQVKLAPDPLNDPEAHEKQLAALMSAWNRAAAVVRQEFLLRIDAPVFDATDAGRAA